MKYPQKSPYLVFKRLGKDKYQVENYLLSETYCVDKKIFDFIRKLDGKHNPKELLRGCSSTYINRIIEELNYYNLLAPKKEIISPGIGSFTYPLIYCYPKKIHKYASKIWNQIQLLLLIPTLIIGVYVFFCGQCNVYMHNKGELILGSMLGICIGIVMHELAHISAGLSYGGYLSEIGVGTSFFIPMAYVMLEDSHIVKRLHRIQINMAGIETNLILFGLLMIFAKIGLGNPFVMYTAGINNLAMAIINILPIDGLDGIKILSEICRKENVLEYAKRQLKGIKRRNKRPLTVKDIIVRAGCAVLIGCQVIMPLLIICELYSILWLASL